MSLPLAKRSSGPAERAGHDDEIADTRSGAAGHAVRATEGRDAQHHGAGARRVAAAHRHSGFRHARIERYDVLDPCVARERERDDEGERFRTRRCEIADVRCRSPEAELGPRDEVEAEVHALDERVLRHDEAPDLGRVVLDPLHEPESLELGEQAELSELVEPHSSSTRARPSSVAGSRAYSAS